MKLNFFFSRPQLSGTLSGHVLGEAAHRLVKNSLQIKSNNTVRLLETPCRNAAQGGTKPRPAGPLGYERGFMEDRDYYQSSTYNPPSSNVQGFSNPRPFQLASDFQECTQNFRMQKSNFQDHVNISTGLANLTIEEGPGFQSHPRMPNARYWPNHQQRIQNAGPPPPLPPINWIGKQTRGYMDGFGIQVPMNWTGRQPARGYGGGFGRPEIPTRPMYDKQQQMSKVYRIKSQMQEPTNSSNQQ